ncbi:MAG: nuclear transport factor 2 family protein [Acidobacteriota bacterium]
MQIDLERLNHVWNQAWLDKDARTADRLMTADYVYIDPQGRAFDRTTLLDIIRSPSYRLHEGTRTEVSIRPLTDDAAVVLHRWQGRGEYGGEWFEDDHRCTMVCVRQAGEWRVALEHCSLHRADAGEEQK